jgi:gliding motility-associated-like protein
VGYGTPGYKNSQYAEYITDDGAVTISPDIFSPDNDGYNDVLNISYSFDQPGYIANIVIYDSRGRLVKNLVKNSLLGTSGSFSWDGTYDNREKANVGVYIIYFEVFDLSGKMKAYKKSGILGSKLK